MRSISLLCLAALLGSCSAAPQPVMRSPSGQRAFDSLISNKVAGPPVSCLPSYNANEMSIIDSRNVAFRVGTGTVYMVHLNEGCSLLGSGNYALLTRGFGGSGLCRGDIAQVFDTMNRQTVGSCTIASIVPYTRVGR
jgi:hypothetical protein